MSDRGYTATALGRIYGVSARVMNHLLKDEDILYGKPGAYGLTPKGETFGVETSHHRGPGGTSSVYNKYWDVTTFDSSIVDALNVSPEKIAAAEAAVAAQSAATRAATKAAQDAADAAYRAAQSASESLERPEIDLKHLGLIVGGVAATAASAFLIYKYGPALKRKLKDRISDKVDEPAEGEELPSV
ncbi:hypothetical protein [Leifsonia sp. Leaf264]|uniref:hypothetical protein n=1 Tax=Leifsonia sp. Leaf264 TaxID=1736314 RepID=UPI0006F44471|nr:hypothetical protein [Leifsonia sp. Leaf264]KQO98403.1 hypothetical protein ASF30_10100 [Leifsonia sp. Leaf264]